MSANNKIKSNVVDLPIHPIDVNDEALGQSSYIQALGNFIKKAQMPMTIAVQGEWGCGKTSLMNAIAGQVCKNYPQLVHLSDEEKEKFVSNNGPFLGVWINTWQYSILKNDNEAQLDVIRGVARELGAQMDRLMGSSTLVKETGRKLLNSLGGLALAAAKVGVSAAGMNPLSLSGLDEMVRAQEKGLEYFREKLQESVKNYLKEYENKFTGVKPKGIIFFIDDLDRLDPPVAVQVLSLLKNLFEVEDCIFVLAIDYEVVVQGLTSRFGARTEQNEREFRSFFDKIIQLTFRVPIDNYDIVNFLLQLLGNINFCAPKILNNQDFQNTIVDFTLKSCGKNPRSIKRMLNTLSLVRELHRISPTKLEEENQRLFLELLYAVVCLQSAYPRVYDELVKRPNLYDWIEQDQEADADEVPTLEQIEGELENDLSATDIVLNEALLNDPWVRKRQKAVQGLLFAIFALIMKSKTIKAHKDRSALVDTDRFRSTKDYLNAIISVSRLAGPSDEDQMDENIDFADLEEFSSYWKEHGTSENTLKQLSYFCRGIQGVFDGQISIMYRNDQIKFYAARSTGRRDRVCMVQLLPGGFLIKEGKNIRYGVGNPDTGNRSITRRVSEVQMLSETDLGPIKERYRSFIGLSRVPNRWARVIQEVIASDAVPDGPNPATREPQTQESPIAGSEEPQSNVSSTQGPLTQESQKHETPAQGPSTQCSIPTEPSKAQ